MNYIAFLGCAHIHTPDFVRRLRSRSDLHVKMVWDHDTERAVRYAKDLGAIVADSIDTVLQDDEIKAVIICSETNRHEELVLASVQQRKHLFVEKPLGIRANDAYRMADAIERAKILFQTGYFLRSQPAYRFLRDEIRKKHFGTITRIRSSKCHGGALKGWFEGDWYWMTDPSQGGFAAFGDLGTHALDLMLWLISSDVEFVTASIHPVINRYDNDDEYGEGLLQFNNGTIGTLASSWVDIHAPINLVIHGTEGMAYVMGSQVFYRSDHVDGTDSTSPWTDLPVTLPHPFDLFLNAVYDSSSTPLITVHEAARCCAVMEALYRSAKEHSWVKPELRLIP